MKRLCAVLGLLQALFPLPVAAQAEARRIFVDAATEAGAEVSDLKPEDFEIREGGEPREISVTKMARRPMRLILMVDTTDGVRQPIGTVRTALTGFLQAVDPRHEMMLVTVAGTMQVRVQPTTERQKLIDAADKIFGTSGANPMHRIIDETFRRFGQTTELRPVMAIVTAEGFASTQQVNPKELTRIGDDIRKRGGVVHTVRLLVPVIHTLPAGEVPTELPVSHMVARATGGSSNDISVNGLAGVLQNLATVINDEQERTPMSYQLDYASAPIKGGKKPGLPEVRVRRSGVRLNVFAAP
jgi:hypothetical protein